ncbi:MAG TPA: ROK family protein [Micromonosporaceae bacterium]
MDEPTLGIDIGGTKTAVGVVDATGRLLAVEVAPTPARDGADAVLTRVAELAASVRAAAGAPVGAAGVGSPGVVDPRRGVVLSATDLITGWTGTPVADALSERLRLPVTVDNDVRAAGLGEARYGAGTGADSALVVSVGTGIGGALIRDGVLVPGASGVAGHLGHLPVPAADGAICSCGRPDHLEAVSAGPALLRAAHRAGLTVADTAALVARAATDDVARAVLSRAATALGRALGGLVNLLDPDVVVVAGGLAGTGEAWWGPLRDAFRAEILAPAVPRLVPTALGRHAGVIGAAALPRAHRPAHGTAIRPDRAVTPPQLRKDHR